MTTIPNAAQSGPTWTKSTYSDGGNNCIEVAHLATTTAVRYSKQPAGPAFQIAPAAFTAFISFAKDTPI
ncbi:DUF397 domain-containing protein [Streptomyces sp. NPDC050485]|uniref:DUF397 domain-containing protein n=1 Tax=Streptomyces sp. NPDC050485 TaxID=3365617 RepID=UPI0037974EA1